MSLGVYCRILHMDRSLACSRGPAQRENKEWRVDFDFQATYVYNGFHRVMTAKAGTSTDLSSIPWGLRNTFDPRKYPEAAVLHDAAYVCQEIERKEADALFLAALQAMGAAWLPRNLRWFGVRVGGWRVWNKRARKKRAQD